MTKFENEIFVKLARMKIDELLKIGGEYTERARFLADNLTNVINGIENMQSFIEIENK